ncbi:expressed unknown protein [Seminavis robusta]|uniref:Fatty acid hydroxylase domain-containing protein n=1 Tax=Seminavis robusta TaxID=568900 RepID=A0A9N8HPU8_9STRA|nr:expressed unknown protein [Seminavis robusta]|eukprot:Sro1104_g241800.1 n/a (434) ;mRNA; f:12728-14029
MVSFVSTYLLTWKVYLSSWRADWKAQQKAIAQLGSHFQNGIPLVSNLLWNVIMFTVLQVLVIRMAGFSAEMERFCWYAVLLPCLVGSVFYYCYKYGVKQVVTSLFSFTTFLQWTQNWLAMQGLALVCLTQTAFFYFAGIVMQPYILPPAWNVSVQFPKDLYEEYLRDTVYCFAALFGVCLVTLPLSARGYAVAMEAAGRQNVTISYTETLMELVYQTVQGDSLFFTVIPILVILQDYFGFRVYTIHIIFAVVETALVNYVVRYKFGITHQLMHEIQPLYAMAHMEHHVCKGVHPTTLAAGLWEFWVNGQSIFMTTQVGLAPIPYALLQFIYMGANVVVHTMWPHPSLLQWHTLHHTIAADVYNVNIPSTYDKEHSQAVAKLQQKLQHVSPFIRYEPLSDLAAVAVMGLSCAILHVGLGIGLGHVDWTERMDWQ